VFDHWVIDVSSEPHEVLHKKILIPSTPSIPNFSKPKPFLTRISRRNHSLEIHNERMLLLLLNKPFFN